MTELKSFSICIKGEGLWYLMPLLTWVGFFLVILNNTSMWIFPWRDVLDTTLKNKVWQWLTAELWVSLGALVSSINKTDRHDITEILLKVALNNITITLIHYINLGLTCQTLHEIIVLVLIWSFCVFLLRHVIILN